MNRGGRGGSSTDPSRRPQCSDHRCRHRYCSSRPDNSPSFRPDCRCRWSSPRVGWRSPAEVLGIVTRTGRSRMSYSVIVGVMLSKVAFRTPWLPSASSTGSLRLLKRARLISGIIAAVPHSLQFNYLRGKVTTSSMCVSSIEVKGSLSDDIPVTPRLVA